MLTTPLHPYHVSLNAKMAEFAGYDMPIQYPEGVMAEHLWTRSNAGLFDVSHMGQIMLSGDNVISFLEKITPSSYGSLAHGKAKYSVLTNPEGGIIDDLIVSRVDEDRFFLVVNGACKDKDLKWMTEHLPGTITLDHQKNRALLALQGPKAATALDEVLNINTDDLGYMQMRIEGDLYISRLGYTGEDGFEISMPEAQAGEIWEKLLGHDDVRPIGLAARDSLRQEMGYPLYGHDIDDTTSPIEADIAWIMGKKDNKTFIGSTRVLDEIENGAARKRVGIKVTGKGVARENTDILNGEGEKIGVLTSGTFSPSLKNCVGQGYIESSYTGIGTQVVLEVRGRKIEAEVAKMPFMPAQTLGSKTKKAA